MIFSLRWSTTRWNNAHKRLFRSSRVKLLYDVGVVFAVVGMLSALALLSNTLFAHPPRLHKRDLDVKPIVPGITTPASHIPVVLVAVVQGQVIHELGHAIAAALDGIPLLEAGFSLFLIFPSFFVSLPPFTVSPTTNRRSLFHGPQSTRLRVIAAGPFHNLLFYLLLFALSSAYQRLPTPAALPIRTQTTRSWLDMFYTDISHTGRVVMYVDASSSLKPYLPTGSIITKLDDLSSDVWTSYLTSPDPAPTSNPGWCIDSNDFMPAPTLCCPSPYDSDPPPSLPSKPPIPLPMAHLSCFDALSLNSTTSRCLDPVPILTSASHSPALGYARCLTSTDCNDNTGAMGEPVGEEETSICIRPRASERLLRISLQVPCVPSPLNATQCESILLWSGPRREIYEQVHITSYLPRSLPPTSTMSFFPFWFPHWFKSGVKEGFGIWFEYTQLATLSLYLFNLLPLPHLDGHHFLRALLDAFLPDADEYSDAEQGEGDVEPGEEDREEESTDIELGFLPSRRQRHLTTTSLTSMISSLLRTTLTRARRFVTVVFRGAVRRQASRRRSRRNRKKLKDIITTSASRTTIVLVSLCVIVGLRRVLLEDSS